MDLPDAREMTPLLLAANHSHLVACSAWFKEVPPGLGFRV